MLFLPVIVDVFHVESVDVAWEEAQNCEADVDQEVRATAGHAIHADGRNCGMRLVACI